MLLAFLHGLALEPARQDRRRVPVVHAQHLSRTRDPLEMDTVPAGVCQNVLGVFERLVDAVAPGIVFRKAGNRGATPGRA